MKKSPSHFLRLGFVAAAGLLFAGCLLTPTTDSVRYFVLSPMATNEPATAGTKSLSVAIGPIDLPPYLLHTAMAVRKGDNEIEYLENAKWSERLDQDFRRTLAVNLSQLLHSDAIELSDWGGGNAAARVNVKVQRFDVDTQGRGALIAEWSITAPGRAVPLKSGEARLVQPTTGAPSSPEIVARTLSELIADFSRELAEAIRDEKELGTEPSARQ